MNDFKFNRVRRNKKISLDDILLEHDDLIMDFCELFESGDLEHLNLSDIDKTILSKWVNKKFNGLSVLFFGKALYHFFSDGEFYAAIEESEKEITDETREEIQQSIKKIKQNFPVLVAEEISKKNSNAVNVRHNKTREQKNRLIEIWKSRTYKTKDACAEAEYKNLGFNNFRTARNSLNNID